MKDLAKKRAKEYAAIINNLERFQNQLQRFSSPKLVQSGYLHKEPMGILAIDQKGGGKDLTQTRLYVWPDERHRVLHLILVGFKNNQNSDIQYSRKYVRMVRQNRGS